MPSCSSATWKAWGAGSGQQGAGRETPPPPGPGHQLHWEGGAAGLGALGSSFGLRLACVTSLGLSLPVCTVGILSDHTGAPGGLLTNGTGWGWLCLLSISPLDMGLILQQGNSPAGMGRAWQRGRGAAWQPGQSPSGRGLGSGFWNGHPPVPGPTQGRLWTLLCLGQEGGSTYSPSLRSPAGGPGYRPEAISGELGSPGSEPQPPQSGQTVLGPGLGHGDDWLSNFEAKTETHQFVVFVNVFLPESIEVSGR